MKIACYTDIHNMQCMLNLPTVLRRSAIQAADRTLEEWGQVDLAVVGGDNVSDYPYWNRSCALPYANWLDIKQKLIANFARIAKGEKVLYVSGNNDLMLGDLPTADNPPYNTCEFYHSGPMKRTLGELTDGEYYGKYAASKGEQAGLYPLAFHYVVEGVDFFGINIDPDTAFNSHDGSYHPEALHWLKAKLDEVDPDGQKLLFVVGHLSATVRTDGELREDMDEMHRTHLYRAFAGHRNLFYLYGHVHGQHFKHTHSATCVLHFDRDGRVLPLPTDQSDSRQVLGDTAAGFHTVHMGGLRPFLSATPNEFFETDGLTGRMPCDEKDQYFEATGTPKLAQYLLIEALPDRVVFRIRNTGSLPGYTPADKPAPYTVFLR